MPTYGHNLSSPELTSIVQFLTTLHPDNESHAITPDKNLNPKN
jgi:hypothetical protein